MDKVTYKRVDIFGNEELVIKDSAKEKQATLFDDYEGFVKKFEPKKTTDDCYTPPEVYKEILEYVKINCNIDGLEIIRPFYPGGDYEGVPYPEDCVVVDNPPFSIITTVVRFYLKNDIRFFLFAPHLTLFSSDVDCTHIVVGANIVYENGAKVKTSFLSNMFGDTKVIGDAELYKTLTDIQSENRIIKPKYVYPNNVLTVSMLSYIVERGVSISFTKDSLYHYRGLDDQKRHGKVIFGSGFLISNQSAAEKKAAEKKAAENDNVLEWKLSKKEKDVIDSLGD